MKLHHHSPNFTHLQLKNQRLPIFQMAMAFLLFLLVSSSLYAQSWTQLGLDIDGEANFDYSGNSVSFSADGNIVAIGAYGNNGGSGTGSAGHVRVYKYISGTWIQQGADIDGEVSGDYSGYSVSLSADGSIVAIGAIANAGSGEGRGHVRVYKFRSGTWIQQGADIDGEADYDASGFSVSLSADGRIVAIGTPYNKDGSEYSHGHVRVYKFISGTWTQQGEDIDGEAVAERFGYSVSLSADGNTVAIGAPNNAGNNGFWRGQVRVYKYTDGTWTQQGADIEGKADFDQSGWSVSLSSDGNTVAIGAPSADYYAAPSRTRVYKYISGTWTQQGEDIDGEVGGDTSGWSVSLSADGSIVAIGGPSNTVSASSGYVRVYKYNGTAWIQQGFDIDGEAIGDQSGFAVSLSADGRRVAIGAPYNGGTSDRGHVRVYGFICPAITPSLSPICMVGNPLNLSANGGITYLWEGPNGFKSSSATPNKPRTVIADMGIYSITLTGTSGCTASATLSVFTGVGNITATSNSPVCNGGTIKLVATAQTPASFKWTKQFGTTIYYGATVNIGPGVKPKDGGIYTVFITGKNGCIAKQEILVTVSALPCPGTRLASEENETEIGMEINAHPNPTSKLLTVEVKLTKPSSLKLQLYNAMGNTLTEWNLSEETTTHRKEIDMSVYKDGLYLIQAQSKDGKQTKRVVKVE